MAAGHRTGRSKGQLRSRDGVPAAVTLVLGAVGLVPATLICDGANVPLPAALALCTVVASLVSIRARVAAAVYVGVLGFALFNGFVEDRQAVLDLHGRQDLLRLAALVLVPASVAAATRRPIRRGSTNTV